MNYLIKGCEVWEVRGVFEADIYIESGVIAEIGSGLKKAKARVIDGRGKVCTPLFIDLHAHLRTPGQEEKEDLFTGLKAALKGGFESVVCMPNTNPPLDRPELVVWLKRQASEIKGANLKVAAAITERLEGKRKNPLVLLAAYGSDAFSDDGNGLNDPAILLAAFKEAASIDRPLLLHEEDYDLSHHSGINEGPIAYKTGIFGNHHLSETIPAVRDILLANSTGARIHLQHVSSRETVRLFWLLKSSRITAEVTPHHLLFDESDTVSLDPMYKVNPPLRSKEDREALLEALIEGTIDCIATDHAPHTVEDKLVPYEEAKSGIAWFELVFPALYTYLVRKSLLGPETIVRALNLSPATILALERPEIAEGKPASLALFDVSRSERFTPEKLISKGKNNPLIGQELYGATFAVFKEGKLRFFEGNFIEEEGRI